MDGIVGEIFKRVVHPAHVPFEAEAEAAKISGTRNGRPRGGLFGDGEDAGEFAVSDFIHALDEIDGGEIFAAAKLIGDPLAGFAGVVEIEHGGDGVHAQAVDVIFVEPEESVRNQVVLDFVAAVVVDERAPIGMRALARVGVFVEMRAVELREAMRVAREMRGSPIENDADSSLMAAIHKFHEYCGRAITAGGGEITERLVAPGAVKGVLHDGEQLDVGVAEIFHVGDELVTELAVGQPAILFLGNAAPGAEVHFVDGDWRFEPVSLRALRNPCAVVPFVVIEAGDDRTGLGPELGTEGVGIRLERQDISIRADNFIFVDCAFVEFGEEEFPDAGRASRTRVMDAAVPTVEVTNDADTLCAGGPYGEVDAADAFESYDVGAEFFVGVVMAALP